MSKVNLCDICDFQGGSQPPKSQWTTLQQDGYIRMLQIRDFTQPGKVKAEYVKMTNTTKCCLKDDILIARYGASLGKILTGLSGAYNVAMTKAVPNEAVISKKFLYYFLCSDTFQNCILNVGVRAAQAGFNKEDLSNIELYCPDLSIQNKICKILELVDVLVNKSKLQLDELDLLVKSRFIEMFGDPIRNDKFWPINKLKDVTIKIGSGATPKGGKESYPNEGIYFIRSLNVHDGLFEFKDLAHLTENQAKLLNNVIVEQGDVLLNITGASVARTCVVPNEILPARVNQHVSIIRCNKNFLNSTFMNRQFLSDSFKRKLLNMGEAGGATRQAITKQQLEDTTVIVPPITLQKEYASFVQQVDKSKFVVTAKFQ